MLRVYFIKAVQKLIRLVKKCIPPVKVLSLDKFYTTHFNGTLPDKTYFTNRKSPSFFFNPSQYNLYVDSLVANYPDSITRTIERAENAIEHTFDLLGSGKTNIGKNINWHTDFISGKTWKHIPQAKIQIINQHDNSDIKVPWELSRLQHFTDTGRAYWLTEDEAYLRDFIQTLTDWEQNNQVGYGPNWTCSMEVAIRAINIIWGLYFFSINNSLSDVCVQQSIRLLYYHGLHIEKNLETIEDGANNNHLLSNYLGLFYIGLLFPEFDRSQTWRKIACEGLEKEIALETFDDGANYECSTSYHRLVLEIFLSASILGAKNDFKFSNRYESYLKKMLNFSEAITTQSGKASFIGDNDNGFIIKLSHENPSLHTHLLELGALYFDHATTENISLTEESLFYLGIDRHRKLKTKRTQSQFFKDSGFAVIRSENLYLLFAAPKLTDKALGGHKHNDNLSFTLEYNKIPFFIDPGTFCYTSDFTMRNKNRSVSSHNTVAIDSQEQNKIIPTRPFFLYDESTPELDLWANMGDLIIVSGFHKGYEKNSSIQHRRTMQVNLKTNQIEITDEFTGDSKDEHLFETRFVTSVTHVTKNKNCQILLEESITDFMTLNFDSDTNSSVEITPKEYFPEYGISKPAQTITRTQTAKLPLINKTTLTLSSVFADTNINLETNQRITKTQLSGDMV